jgi:hypothetical protein
MDIGRKQSEKKSSFFTGNHLLIIALAWIMVQAFLFYKNGIVTEFESGKYIEQANNLLQHGRVSTPNFWLYSIQIFLIALSIKLHAGFILVVIVQLFFNALATLYFYKLCTDLTGKRTALVCALFLVFNFPFQAFNTFLFTESLFYSFLIIFSCFLFRLNKLTAVNFIKIILFLLLICFTRPTGLLLIPCVFIYLFSKFFHSFPAILKISSVVIVSLLFIFMLNLALGSGGELNFVLPLAEEHIICGVPTVIVKGTVHGNSLLSILNYIFEHPAQFLHLALLRTLAFFGLYRSYFSTGHNLYLAIYLFPIYILVLLSLKEWWQKNRSLVLYALSFIFITWETVMLSCDDWHNRFFLSLAPVFYILSLPALKKIIDYLFH